MITLKRKLSRFREYLDTLVTASALSQTGEVGLARALMSSDEEGRTCCGEIAVGRDCLRIVETRCRLALQQ